MPIAFPRWPPDWPEIEAAALEILRSGDWGVYQSDTCEALRKALADAFGVGWVRLCPSGTAAVEIGLRAAGVGPGDEVILAALDYPGNFRCIELLGARPVLVDVGAKAPTLNPDDLHAAGSEKVKAVIASHLFGQAADVAAIRDQCDQHGWTLVEDACQVPGMTIAGRPAGSFGHLATLSFGGSKLLTCGTGGALLTDNRRLAARLGPLVDRPSDTFPLAPLQAAVLMPQLARLDQLNERRRQTVDFLRAELAGITPGWELLASESDHVAAAFYKLAWVAASPDQRAEIVGQASRLGLPIGAGFRSTIGASQRRCRQPVPLPHSKRFGDALFLLDHRALLVEPDQREELAELLCKLHEATCR